MGFNTVFSNTLSPRQTMERVLDTFHIDELKTTNVTVNELKHFIYRQVEKPADWKLFNEPCQPEKSFGALFEDPTKGMGNSRELRLLRAASEKIRELYASSTANQYATFYQKLRAQQIQSAITHQYLFDDSLSDYAKYKLLLEAHKSESIPDVAYYKIMDDITAGIVLKKVAALTNQEFRIGTSLERELKLGDFFVGSTPVLIGYNKHSALNAFNDINALANYFVNEFSLDHGEILAYIASHSPQDISIKLRDSQLYKLRKQLLRFAKMYSGYKNALDNAEEHQTPVPVMVIAYADLLRNAQGRSEDTTFITIAESLTGLFEMAGE